MITINEMLAYKAKKEQAELDEKYSLEREITALVDRILDMNDEIVEMIEYGKVALECGLIPTIGEHRRYDYGSGVYNLSTHSYTNKRKPNCVYTDGIYHNLGFISDRDRSDYTVERYFINGIGIENGGACGECDLVVSDGHVCWTPRGECAKYNPYKYKECLEEFLTDFPAWKKRVLDLVEKNAR